MRRRNNSLPVASSAFGVPYLDLNRIATDVNADAIVIGSHGASWLREVLLGSVADAILRHSTRPVLVLKVDREEALADFEGAVLVVSHDPATAAYARRVLHLDKGILVEGTHAGQAATP